MAKEMYSLKTNYATQTQFADGNLMMGGVDFAAMAKVDQARAWEVLRQEVDKDFKRALKELAEEKLSFFSKKKTLKEIQEEFRKDFSRPLSLRPFLDFSKRKLLQQNFSEIVDYLRESKVLTRHGLPVDPGQLAVVES